MNTVLENLNDIEFMLYDIKYYLSFVAIANSGNCLQEDRIDDLSYCSSLICRLAKDILKGLKGRPALEVTRHAI